MSKAEASLWAIDKIVCSQWNEQSHTADVYISNYQGDSIDLQVVRTPGGDIVPFNITGDFRSADWYEFTSEKEAVDSIILEVQQRLDFWASEVERITKLLAPKNWQTGRGKPVPKLMWASLAYLYGLRSSMYETRIIEQLAQDLGCDVSTVKERVKNLRRKGFLSAPGQGARGEGKALSKALKVLKKEGILDA